ncbi:MAG: hypothetical protein V2I43_10820 [Parvularcula sp.]|jgi:hypothetical protein|nr:hypothetical protein [Parvularcula sp.]
MPLSFTPTSSEDNWKGATWSVDDEDTLAAMIARIAIGQSRVVGRVLKKLNAEPPGFPKGGFAGARALLTLKAEDEDPYHRDGWVFQAISWIAMNKQEDNALIRAPQSRKADKGLDGLLIRFDDKGVAHVVICEEKATEHPRQKVQSQVWPEFIDFESGARDHELVAGVTSLLATSGEDDPDAVVADILWEDVRAYRVAVTVGDSHATTAGRKRLFKGYEETVDGDVERRQAETLHLEDVREWISDLAAKATAVIDAAEAAYERSNEYV